MASLLDAPEKIIKAAAEIYETSAKDAGAIGYATRLLTLVGLPHQDPKARQYVRKNGSFRMTVSDPTNVGLPFGVIPRLLLIWVSTQVVLTKKKTTELGDNLNQFLGNLDIAPSGGHLGSTTRVLNQLSRLSSSILTIHYQDDQGRGPLVPHAPITNEFNLWFSRTLIKYNGGTANSFSLTSSTRKSPSTRFLWTCAYLKRSGNLLWLSISTCG